jgi:hypothetical protein
MRTFAQKPKATQRARAAKSTMLGRTHVRQTREVNYILDLQRSNRAVQQLLEADTGNVEGDSTTTEIARFGYDFGRIPVHATSFITGQHRDRVASPIVYPIVRKKPDGQHQQDKLTRPHAMSS